jgi:hypothetical protein
MDDGLGRGQRADMSYNGPLVPLYRPPSRGAVPYKTWQDDAACQGQDAELFEIELPVRQLSKTQREDQEELISWGLAICAGCPVRASCLTNSSDLDRYWTTRGGQPPEGLFHDSKMPDCELKRYAHGSASEAGREVRKRKLKTQCKRGHEDWGVRKADGKRFCITCKRDGDKLRWGKKG